MTRIYCMMGMAIALTGCQHDKEAHFAAGLAVSNYVSHQTGSQLKGCAAALTVGVLKEAIDAQGHGVVDGNDVLATVGGCQFTYRF